jgi:hypothetical protein
MNQSRLEVFLRHHGHAKVRLATGDFLDGLPDSAQIDAKELLSRG